MKTLTKKQVADCIYKTQYDDFSPAKYHVTNYSIAEKSIEERTFRSADALRNYMKSTEGKRRTLIEVKKHDCLNNYVVAKLEAWSNATYTFFSWQEAFKYAKENYDNCCYIEF